MAITRVQTNGSAQTNPTNATPPAWGVPTTTGNLLLMLCAESNPLNNAWPVRPGFGWNAYAPTPTDYATSSGSLWGIFWMIALGSDPTPSNWGATTAASGTYVTYTYEFASPNGWNTSAADTGVCPLATATLTTSRVSGSTPTLAQPNELCFAMAAGDTAMASASFTNGFVIDEPATSDTRLRAAWQEVNATTPLSTTCTYTATARSNVRIATFLTGFVPPPLRLPRQFPSRVNPAYS